MPDRIIRWRTADGRSGRFTASGPSARRSGPTTRARPVRAVRAAPPPPPPSPLAALRARLGMPASATDEQVIAAAAERLAPRPAAAPAPAPAPLVSAAGPTPEQLLEEAAWEEANARLFGLPLGPATTALAAAGAPSPEQVRSDAHAAAQRAQDETFARAAEADRRAQVAEIDAARASRGEVSAQDRRAREDLADRLLFPELRP